MGLELRLLPFDKDHGDVACSFTILNCVKDRYLFDQIQKLPELPVLSKFSGFFDEEVSDGYGYGIISKNLYEEDLKYACVKDLLKCKPSSDATINKAIWAYLKHLSPHTKVALYWH